MPEHSPAPSPERAVYGFVMYLCFKLFFVLFVLWAYVPHSWFESIGITDLPTRYWAVAIPMFLLTVFTVFAFFIYPSLGLCMTPSWNDLRTIKDSKCKSEIADKEDSVSDDGGDFCCCKNISLCKKREFDKIKNSFPKQRVPLLQDLSVVEVSEHLYLK